VAIVNEIKCARCDRKYSGVRSRCPYCGARRIGRGKYSEDSENAKGKMLISVIIMAVFTVAAGVLLFTTDVDAVDPATIESPDLDSIEDGIISLPPVEVPSPSPQPEPSPVAPPAVLSVEIWVAPRSHRTEDFTLDRVGQSIDLTAIVDPVSLQESVDIDWLYVAVREDEDENDPVFEFAPVPGGIKVLALRSGGAKLRVTAGDKTAETWVRVK